MNIKVIVLGSLLISAGSCGLFKTGNSGHGQKDLIGTQCTSNADCLQGQLCSNNVCAVDPTVGQTCETASDCGNTLIYTCNNGICEKTVAQYSGEIARPAIIIAGSTCTDTAQCGTGMLCTYNFTSLADFQDEKYILNTTAGKTCKKINGESCTTVSISELSGPDDYSVLSISSECMSGFCDTDQKCGLKQQRYCSEHERDHHSDYRMCRSNHECPSGLFWNNKCE